MGVPAIVQKSTLGPAVESFNTNTQREGSDRILEGKQAVVRQFHGCFFSHLSCSQPLPFLPHPSRRSMKRCRCQMTQPCQQTQTADSEGKRAVPEDSFCKTAGIYVEGGWYEEETDGWSRGVG